MPLTSTNVILSYSNIVTGVPIVVPIPVFHETEVFVRYGAAKLIATQGSDYGVVLDAPDPAPPPNTQNYQHVTITPTAALLAKIAVDGTNIIYVERILPLTTDFTALDAFTRDNIDVEFARTNMKLQQVNEATELGLLPDPTLGDPFQFVRVTANRDGYELVDIPGGGDMLRSNNLADVIDPAASLDNINGQPRSPILDGLASLSVTPGFMVHDGSVAFAKRSLVAGANISITNVDGQAGNPTIALNNGNLNAIGGMDATPGLLVQTGASAYTRRTITAGNTGVTVANGAGTAGNPSISASAALQAVHVQVNGAPTGFLATTGVDIAAVRTLGSGTGITVTNADGVAGNPSIAINTAASLTWTGAHTFQNQVTVQYAGPFLIVDATSGNSNLEIRGLAGTIRVLAWRTGAQYRWSWQTVGIAESGGNAGSDLYLYRYDDAGTSLGQVLAFNRANGSANFGGSIVVQPVSGVAANITAIATGAADAGLNINAPVQRDHNIMWQTSGSIRWRMNYDGSAEGGANAGSNWVFQRYTDAGALLATTLKVTRSSGLWEFNDGLVNVGDGTGFPQFLIRGAAGQAKQIQFHSGANSRRWQIQSTVTAETGGNAGSDFSIDRYSDANAFLGSAITINRADGTVTLGTGLADNGVNFTPGLTFGGAAVGMTFTGRQGRWWRINAGLIAFELTISLSAKGSSVGAALITALPVVESQGVTTAVSIRANTLTSGAGDTHLSAVILSGSSTIRIDKMVGATSTQLTDADFQNSTILQIAGIYAG